MATGPNGTRRAFLRAAATGIAAGLAGCSGGGDGAGAPAGTGTRDTTQATTRTMTQDFTFETTAFDAGASIPPKYTCDGEDTSPPLSLSGVPEDAETVAIIVDDPDAPGGTFTHWLVWNVPGSVDTVPGGIGTGRTVPSLDGARMGENDFGSNGYRGPCPPTGDGAHTYRFTAYAASRALSTPAGADRATLEADLEGATVGTSRFTGEYARE